MGKGEKRGNTSGGESSSKRSRQSASKGSKAIFVDESEIGPWEIQLRGTPDQMDDYERSWRRMEAKYFLRSYSDGYIAFPGKHPTIKETRHIVVSGKPHLTSNDISHGIPWVGVCGVGTICAVYKEDEPGIERICKFIGQTLRMQYFWMYLLSEMEGLASSSIGTEDLVGKPFAVVSVNSFTSDDEESCHKARVLDDFQAIRFLQDKLKANSSIAYDETIQIAIDAFQKLFGREFKAREINVMIFEDRGGLRRFLTNVEVRKHLTTINQPESGDSPLSDDDDVPPYDLKCVFEE